MNQGRSMDEILRLILEMSAEEERATVRETERVAHAGAPSAKVIDFNKVRSRR
jgi:hypothetical protein